MNRSRWDGTNDYVVNDKGELRLLTDGLRVQDKTGTDTVMLATSTGVAVTGALTVGGASVASGTEGAAITAASEAHALNATFSDVEVETALNTLGAKINALITALENFNIIAPN